MKISNLSIKIASVLAGPHLWDASRDGKTPEEIASLDSWQQYWLDKGDKVVSLLKTLQTQKREVKGEVKRFPLKQENIEND